MSTPTEIPFDQLIKALLDVDNPLPPRFLYRLSDLEGDELAQLKAIWGQIPGWRRKALIEDCESMGERDFMLSFHALVRFAIEDEDSQVRLPAVRSLWEYDEPELIAPLLHLAEHDSDLQVRAAAVSGLGKYIYAGELEEIPEADLHRVEEILLEMHRADLPMIIRRRALESLGFSSREEVAGLIENAFGLDEREWVVSALIAMGRSADSRWQRHVMSKLDHLAPDIRAEAARAAGELEIHKARRRLLKLLDDPDERVREAVIWSLSQIGGEGVHEALEALYEETEDDHLAELIEASFDNLAFTEDMILSDLMDIEVDVESDELDLIDNLKGDEDEEDDLLEWAAEGPGLSEELGYTDEEDENLEDED